MHQIIDSTITGTSSSRVVDSAATEAKRARLAQARAVVIAQFGAAILVPPPARSPHTHEHRGSLGSHPTSSRAFPLVGR